jgi:uncharacterized protein (DUF885 family)
MSDLQPLIDGFLDEEFRDHPVHASSLGLTGYDEGLDDLSAEAFDRRDASDAAWLERFESVGPENLTDDERIDRDLAIAVLRGRTILADWAEWRRDPLTYSDPVANGVFYLFLHRLRSDGDLVDAAVARLEQAPAALEAGQRNLDPGLASPLIVRRALGSARGLLRYCRDLLPSEVEAGPDRDRLTAASSKAAPAIEAWAGYLEDLAGRATGGWDLGEVRYSRLLRERESLPFDARELRERGRAEYDRVAEEMAAICREARGTSDYWAVLEEANRDHAADEEGMRATYASWTEKARDFLARMGLVTLPAGERCIVMPSPVFRRPVIGVASYVSPPAFSDRLLGHFFVPFTPDGSTPDEVRQRLESNSNGDIPTVSVHETYPGHHWHLVMRKSNPSRLRRTFGTPYFTEGWALYAERAMRERGFFEDPMHELYHLNAILFRAARIVVDTSLHLGEMSVDEAVDFMVRQAGMLEATARVEVARYCAWPTQASAYLTGCLEILRIREAYFAARGWDGPAANAPIDLARDFNDGLASSGALPLGLAERAVMAGYTAVR